jgi:hypothetical protein
VEVGKAHSKLLVQDAWLLSAEELLALLRALVDDLLASTPELEVAMDARLLEVYELQKRKKAMDATFRKLQTTMNKENLEFQEALKSADGLKSTRSNTKLQTVSAAQLETAKRQQQLAKYNYDKACLTKRVRTLSCGLSFRQ